MASIGSARFLLREAVDGERDVALAVLELYDPADNAPHGAAIVDAVDGAGRPGDRSRDLVWLDQDL